MIHVTHPLLGNDVIFLISIIINFKIINNRLLIINSHNAELEAIHVMDKLLLYVKRLLRIKTGNLLCRLSASGTWYG